ncbi:MAG: helix-turn-helix domain-containing protein [Nitrospinae bacterium]|nr:helix-turn-helix domain-containing protein [Nitrospinota bacterium]
MPTSPKDTPSMTRGFLSIEHAAQWSDVSIKTVRRWISQGLPRYQEGPRSKVLIRPGDIEQFLTRQQAPKPELDVMVDQVMAELQRGKG